MSKMLGKIKSVKFGRIGCDKKGFGARFELGNQNQGVVDYLVSESKQWTNAEAQKALAEVMQEIIELLAKAKVDTVDQLVGIPVEVTFDGVDLVSWRILEEVL